MALKQTYRQKLKFLPLLFLVSVLLTYWFAITETVNIKGDCIRLHEEARIADNAPVQTALIRKKLDDINQIAGKDSLTSETDPLLEFVSHYTNRSVNLVDYQPLHTYQHQKYKVETRTAIFEGSYTNLLKFLFTIEKKFRSGKIVSVKFETETNLKTEHKRLLMTMYVQSVKNDAAINADSLSIDNHKK
ncbi:MAG: hypothetical protein Q8928_10350 [Bacteroidota bacterium]|nr:hypothetical protein [Bacteroidota bacterium]